MNAFQLVLRNQRALVFHLFPFSVFLFRTCFNFSSFVHFRHVQHQYRKTKHYTFRFFFFLSYFEFLVSSEKEKHFPKNVTLKRIGQEEMEDKDRYCEHLKEEFDSWEPYEIDINDE